MPMIVGDCIQLLTEREFFCIIVVVVAVVNDIHCIFTLPLEKRSKERFYSDGDTQVHDINGEIQHFAFDTQSVRYIACLRPLPIAKSIMCVCCVYLTSVIWP